MPRSVAGASGAAAPSFTHSRLLFLVVGRTFFFHLTESGALLARVGGVETLVSSPRLR